MRNIRTKSTAASVLCAVAVVFALICAVTVICVMRGNMSDSADHGSSISAPVNSVKTDEQWADEGYTALTSDMIESGYGYEGANTPGVIWTIVRYDEESGEYLNERNNKFYLKDDIVTSKTFVFRNLLYAYYAYQNETYRNGAHAVLDLNGHVIRHTGAFGAAVAVMGNVRLTVKDSAPAVKHAYAVVPQFYTDADVVGATELMGYRYSIADKEEVAEADDHIVGGVITGGKRPSKYVKNISDPEKAPNFSYITDDPTDVAECSHGGVYITHGARVVMEGGNIAGNYTDEHGGGGVAVYGSIDYSKKYAADRDKALISEFTMTGGEIKNNNVGAYVVSSGSMIMTGGSITANTADQGGGVYVSNGTFDMSGGTVSGNTAVTNGGGVFVSSYSSTRLILSGNAVISGNKKAGINNNIFLSRDALIYCGTFAVGAKYGISCTTNRGPITSGYAANNSGAAAALPTITILPLWTIFWTRQATEIR